MDLLFQLFTKSHRCLDDVGVKISKKPPPPIVNSLPIGEENCVKTPTPFTIVVFENGINPLRTICWVHQKCDAEWSMVYID